MLRTRTPTRVLGSSDLDAAMALQERTETDQRDGVFAMQGAGDFFQYRIQDTVGLFFGEVSLFSDGGGEIWFDDLLVRKDGRFIPGELAPLNPENLK